MWIIVGSGIRRSSLYWRVLEIVWSAWKLCICFEGEIKASEREDKDMEKEVFGLIDLKIEGSIKELNELDDLVASEEGTRNMNMADKRRTTSDLL